MSCQPKLKKERRFKLKTRGLGALAIPLVAAVMLITNTTAVHAQQGLVGTYKGQYQEPQYPTYKTQTATLVITGVQDGKVVGKYELDRFECNGKYDIQGTILDSQLELRTGEGSMRGCGDQRLSLRVEGNKLVGSTSMEARSQPGITLVRQ